MKLKYLAAALIAALAASGAQAQQAGDNVVNVGWFHLAPQDSSSNLKITGSTPPGLAPTMSVPNTGATVDDADTLGLTFTHFFTDNIAAEAVLGIAPKFHLSGKGLLANPAINPLGSARQWSPALLLKYYFGRADSKIRPFLGMGVSYVWYSNISLNSGFNQGIGALLGAPGSTTSVSLSNTWAPVFNGGLVWNFDKHWSMGLSVSYLPMSTRAQLTTTVAPGVTVHSETKVRLNPIVTFLSLGYRF